MKGRPVMAQDHKSLSEFLGLRDELICARSRGPKFRRLDYEN